MVRFRQGILKRDIRVVSFQYLSKVRFHYWHDTEQELAFGSRKL